MPYDNHLDWQTFNRNPLNFRNISIRMFFLLIIHNLSPRAEAKWGFFLAPLITIFIVELRVCKQDRRICSSVVLEAARPGGQAATHWEDELQCLAFCVRGSFRVTETDDLHECKSLQTSAIHVFTKILASGNRQGPFSRRPLQCQTLHTLLSSLSRWDVLSGFPCCGPLIPIVLK